MDKRRHPRFIKRLTATFFVDHHRLRGISSDVSAGGLFIRTTRGLAVNTPIDIELLLPNNKISLLKGIVRRTVRTPISSIKNGMGIEITEKDATFTDFVKTVISESRTNTLQKDDTAELRTISFSGYNARRKEPTNTMQERRRHKRLRVEHLQIDSEIPSVGEIRVLNISTNGVLLKACSRLEIGGQYAVRIGYADRILFAEADVVWSLLLGSPEGTDSDNELPRSKLRGIKTRMQGSFTPMQASRNSLIKPIYLTGMQFTSPSDKKIKEIVNLIEFNAREILNATDTEPAELMIGCPPTAE